MEVAEEREEAQAIPEARPESSYITPEDLLLPGTLGPQTSGRVEPPEEAAEPLAHVQIEALRAEAEERAQD